MLYFRINNTSVRVDFTFFAVLAFFLILDRTGQGTTAFAACVTHELAHLAVMFCLNVPVSSLTFYGGGIALSSSELYRAKSAVRAAVYSAGCAMNFAVAAVLFSVGIIPAALINLFTGIINLLPFGELDGARLLDMLLTRFAPPEKVSAFERAASAVSAAGLVVAAIWYCKRLPMSLAITGAYFIAVSLVQKSKQIDALKNVGVYEKNKTN